MVEQRAVNARVVGSSPTGAATFSLPCGVTGSISDFDSDGLGSNPGGAAKLCSCSGIERRGILKICFFVGSTPTKRL